MRAALVLASLLAAVALPLAACGGETGQGGSGGDGKVHPAGNGVHMAENDACAALDSQLTKRALELGCTITVPTCPSFVQAMVGGTACMEYDQGSVLGCTDYYVAQTGCEALSAAADKCVVTAFQGTEPAGCP